MMDPQDKLMKPIHEYAYIRARQGDCKDSRKKRKEVLLALDEYADYCKRLLGWRGGK